MQIEIDHRIEESGDRTRIELFQSAMVNTGISMSQIGNTWRGVTIFKKQNEPGKYIWPPSHFRLFR